MPALSEKITLKIRRTIIYGFSFVCTVLFSIPFYRNPKTALAKRALCSLLEYTTKVFNESQQALKRDRPEPGLQVQREFSISENDPATAKYNNSKLNQFSSTKSMPNNRAWNPKFRYHQCWFDHSRFGMRRVRIFTEKKSVCLDRIWKIAWWDSHHEIRIFRLRGRFFKDVFKQFGGLDENQHLQRSRKESSLKKLSSRKTLEALDGDWWTHFVIQHTKCLKLLRHTSNLQVFTGEHYGEASVIIAMVTIVWWVVTVTIVNSY